MSKLIKNEVERLISVINDQIESLLSHQSQIPIIEIDLTKDSIKKLYQQLDYLTKPIDKNIELEKIIGKIDKETNDLIDIADSQLNTEVETSEDNNKDSGQENIEEEKTEVIEPKDEPKEDIKKEVNEPKEIDKDEINPLEFQEEQIIEEKKSSIKEVDSEKEKTPSKKISKKQNNKQQISIIDVISDEETSLGDQFQKTNIKDLKSAIGINDKFQFINDLFEGSMSEYNKFINTIDNLNSKEQAINFLNENLEKHNWNADNETYKLFNNYLERRF